MAFPSDARAHWVARDLVVWPGAARARSASFHAAADPPPGRDAPWAGERVETWPLEPAGPAPAAGLERWARHLIGAPAYRLSQAAADSARSLLRGWVAVSRPDGRRPGSRDRTGLQIPGVIDDLFPYHGPLGITWAGDAPVFRLWAPTARAVTLERWPQPGGGCEERLAMERHERTGVWTVLGVPAWRGQWYRFALEVFTPATGRIERNLVTDPYALSVSGGSRLALIVDLDDPELAPEGWPRLEKPPPTHPSDTAVYELHVRDFSAHDASVPAADRGRYRAFAATGSHGMRHLRALAEAGLTHVQLLPTFDFATVPDDPADRREPEIPHGLPPDSPIPQRLVAEVRDVDSYNWGYDPLHFLAPEGSYASAADTPARVLEHRAMVAALNGAGLRVVADVVFNHTHAAGQDAGSILDRIVPGYYHRLDERGRVTTSTCCPNTAAEHRMMERLVVDAVLSWAIRHRVDGFRFDLMGHHPRSTMLAVRAALDRLRPGEHGVDGPSILLYGEGWDFGEVAGGARFEQATQANLAGTGIGTFNDRLRDAARGGGPSGARQAQGFVTGLAVDPNEAERRSAEQQRAAALRAADLVRAGLAGNLASFAFESAAGERVETRTLRYHDAAAGYAGCPADNVVYVSAHDDATLFDAIQCKAPRSTAMRDRVRMQNLGLALVALAQGTAFFHAGSDMLRSKSLDRDSYDSGDWFNRLDFSCRSNNWGAGLPPEERNGADWPLLGALLRELEAPLEADIRSNAEHLRELLRIRASTDLFRRRTAGAIRQGLSFLDTGPGQQPGVIVMLLTAGPPAPSPASPYRAVLVVFNATPRPTAVADSGVPKGPWLLHPVQRDSVDPVVRDAAPEPGGFAVPPRTTAVFVRRSGPVHY